MQDLEFHRSMHAFFYPSLAVAGALAASAGPAGVLVTLRRDSLLALALPQVVTLGVAIALRLEMHPLIPSIILLAVALGIVAWARLSHRADQILPVLFVTPVALTILLVKNAGQHLSDVQNRFTGIDVALSPDEFTSPAIFLLVLVLPICFFWRRWLLLAQAPATAQIAGIRPARWHFLFLATLSTIVLLGTNYLSLAMVVALLFLPAAAALPWARRLPWAMALSIIIAIVSVEAGFILSNEQDWPFSQCVAAAGAAMVAASYLLRAAWIFLARPKNAA